MIFTGGLKLNPEHAETGADTALLMICEVSGETSPGENVTAGKSGSSKKKERERGRDRLTEKQDRKKKRKKKEAKSGGTSEAARYESRLL